MAVAAALALVGAASVTTVAARAAQNPGASRAGEVSKPVSMRAVGFAESVPLRDLTPVLKTARRSMAEKEKEINLKNRKVIRQIDPNARHSADGALSSDENMFAPGPNPPLPPTVSFEGMSIADTIAVSQGFLPPDTNGEVGPNHYVQTVNSTFRIWDKAGNPLIPTTPLSNLFAPLGGVCGSSNDGDPIVLYDQLADRWFISQFCTVADPNNHQVIAISKTGDPTGAYFLYNFSMPNNKFNDYPHFGMWPDAYYMTDNQFNQAGTAFLGGGRFAFDRAKMLVGDPTASYIYFDSCPTNLNCFIGGELPSDLDGLTPPPAGAPNVFAYFTAVEWGDPSDAVRLFDFHADFATPANSTFTERTGSPLVVAAFDPDPVPNTRKVIPQPPPANANSFLDAIGDRLMFRLAYRKLGATESLVMNHTVNAAVNPAYRAGVRFYQFNRATPTAAFTIAEQQTFAGGVGDTEHRWMGSAAMNFQGDIAVGYSVSSLTVFPSIRYAAKLGTDAPGSGLFQGEQNIIAGGGSQTSLSNRWGDYSDMTVDPTDDCSFWFTQEYYSVSSESGNSLAPWKTRIAKFAPGACSTSPRGTISGAITNCSTSAPIANAIVQIAGGYSRATLANGTYTATVQPGTYNATATKPGFDTASTTGLVVANAGTATFNACLNANAGAVVTATKTVTGNFHTLGAIVYTVTLSNSGLGAQADNVGHEFTDTLPTSLALVSANASSGTAGTTGNTVNWNGSIPAGGSVTITINATINATTPTSLVVDGGFEATTNTGTNPNWVSTSTLFGSALCTASWCGTGGTTAGPRNGSAGWVWFDGTGSGINAEVGTAQQTVTIPPGGTVSLTYYLRMGSVTAPASSVFTVAVDGTTLQTFNEPATAEPAYTQRTLDLTAYADGAPHVLRFNYSRPAGTSNSDTFTLDDVALLSNVGTAGLVSNQGTANVDTNGDGINETVVLTDNPALPGASDATVFLIGSAYYTVTPCRVVDTRNPAGPLAGPALVAQADRTFTIPGNCGIPMTAKAVSINIAVVGGTVAGHLRLHPGGTPVPLISAINFKALQIRANNAVSLLNASGQLGVFNGQPTGTVHVIVDVNGYFQ